ncbi:LOW QUALITY PROTEIN: ERI1 exoribonuclease 2 [Glossophaga mutica]
MDRKWKAGDFRQLGCAEKLEPGMLRKLAGFAKGRGQGAAVCALLRQLGLIRRKSTAAANENLGRSKFKQLFDYLIVIDFQLTCWNDGKRHQTQEIIEFPAVLLSTSTAELTESEFHAYVQPQEHPVLPEFCMELTGIKQPISALER